MGVRARGEASQPRGKGSVIPARESHAPRYLHVPTRRPVRDQETRVWLCTSPAWSRKSHVPRPPGLCPVHRESATSSSQDLPVAFVAGLRGAGITLNLPGGNGLRQLDGVKRREKIKAAVPQMTQRLLRPGTASGGSGDDHSPVLGSPARPGPPPTLPPGTSASSHRLEQIVEPKLPANPACARQSSRALTFPNGQPELKRWRVGGGTHRKTRSLWVRSFYNWGGWSLGARRSAPCPRKLPSVCARRRGRPRSPSATQKTLQHHVV